MSLPEQHVKAQHTIFKESDRKSRMPKERTMFHGGFKRSSKYGNREKGNFNGNQKTFQLRNTLSKITKKSRISRIQKMILTHLTEPHRPPRDKNNKQFPLQRDKQQRVSFQRAAAFPST